MTRITIAGIGLAVVTAGTITAVALTGSSGPGSAADLIRGDGYSVSQDLSATQVQKELAANGAAGIATLFGGTAAMGFRGPDTEAAVHLTDSGAETMKGLLPILQNAVGGKGVHIAIRDGYLVAYGPSTAFADGSAFNFGG